MPKAALGKGPSLRSDGTWVQNYYDAEGLRKQATGKTAAEAQTKAKDKITVSHTPMLAERRRGLTVGDYVSAYIDASAAGRDGKVPLTGDTLRSYKLYADNYIIPALGKIELRQLKRADVEKFRHDLIQRGGNRTTLNKPLTLLNMVLNYAVKAEVIPVNPGKGVRIEQDWSARQDHLEERIPSISEMQQLDATALACYRSDNQAIATAYQRYYPLYLILRLTGMRFSECIGLRWEDFDKDYERVQIRRRVSVPKEGMAQEDRVGRNKSKHSRRTVPLPHEIGAALKEWRQHCPHTPEGWLFPTRNGTVMNYHNVRDKFWIPLLRRADLKHINLHSLRHFYASNLMRKGLAKQASQFLGHSSVAFTMDVYGHLLPDDREMLDAVRAAVTTGM